MIYIGTRKYKYGRMVMSHMMADTVHELKSFAFILGVKDKHFQDKPNRPHFDICQQKKKLALKTGFAKEMNDKKIIEIQKKIYGK